MGRMFTNATMDAVFASVTVIVRIACQCHHYGMHCFPNALLWDASDQSLHCLPKCILWNATHKYVNNLQRFL